MSIAHQKIRMTDWHTTQGIYVYVGHFQTLTHQFEILLITIEFEHKIVSGSWCSMYYIYYTYYTLKESGVELYMK